MTTTITYEVPTFKGSAELDRYGEYAGDVLMDALLTGDGQAVTKFLAGFAEVKNRRFDEAEARYGMEALILAALPAIVAEVSLTGFKAKQDGPSYRRKLVVNEGEGCEHPYCDLAAKFRLPPVPEGMTYKGYTLACQKHAIESVDSRATFIAKGDEGYTYLTSDQHRRIREEARDALKAVTA